MARISKEFVKMETRLLNDYRWWTLGEFEQLLYVKLLMISRFTQNKIPKNWSVIKGYLRTNRSESEIESAVSLLKETFPKLKENKYFWYFDGYENRLGVGEHKKSPNGQPDEDEDLDKDKEIKVQFDSLWVLCLRRDGKKPAFRHYKTSLKNGATFERIKKALLNYNQHIEDNKIEPKFIKMGSTFFNNWEDWENYESKRKILSPTDL